MFASICLYTRAGCGLPLRCVQMEGVLSGSFPIGWHDSTNLAKTYCHGSPVRNLSPTGGCPQRCGDLCRCQDLWLGCLAFIPFHSGGGSTPCSAPSKICPIRSTKILSNKNKVKIGTNKLGICSAGVCFHTCAHMSRQIPKLIMSLV